MTDLLFSAIFLTYLFIGMSCLFNYSLRIAFFTCFIFAFTALLFYVAGLRLSDTFHSPNIYDPTLIEYDTYTPVVTL